MECTAEIVAFVARLKQADAELSGRESVGRVQLLGATESAESWRRTLEVYRSVIDKSLDGLLSWRVRDELI